MSCHIPSLIWEEEIESGKAVPALILLGAPQWPEPHTAMLPLQYVGAPVAYIQQIFVKATVSPWQKNFLAVDVFRSPLSRVFQLVEEIRNHALRDR